MNSRQLPIPIYLNQRIVFDLLAIVEEGFSQLRTVKTSESEAQAKKGEITGEIGLSNVFAFLGIGMKAARSEDDATTKGREISEERVFTPTSLFSRLRETLIQRKLLQILDADYKIDTFVLHPKSWTQPILK